MTKSKHTPLPWKVYYAKNNGQVILGTGEENGCAIQTHQGAFWRDDVEAKANAEFVVKCVNTHYLMLEALKNLENDDGKAMPATAWKLVQDAIAKAEGA
jgi:hypothetical protein